MPGLTREQELARLAAGGPGERPYRTLTFEIDAITAEDPATILARVREVLTLIVREDADHWPSDATWATRLPRWFVEASAPEESDADGEARMADWAKLSAAERDAAEASERWTVGDFVYWFQPANRQWWWWDAEVTGPSGLRVHLVVEDRTVADEALQWLLRAAGASEVINQNLRRLRH